ncbi:GIY-YIG nuclease family protein [Coleofasciculus sp. H7-2]|uniref:GIY-YIG nuclease family protein n=1 Tax=Coleofasciculus sp. H7-2 TaxID=3351545 RepID=UPI00366B6142
MNAEEHIRRLSHIAIKSRDLLPEQSGIYYVIDEKSIIWYIGQAKNLRSRWAGDSHHRFYQLQKQRKKQFTIYYELVAELQLDAIERQRIEQYSPQLNGTKVKIKKLHPTETLLRETLVILAPYSFVLGIESPRKEDLKLIEDSVFWQDEWRVQKAVLPLKVIHVCINLNELGEAIKDQDWLSMCRFLKKVFRKRSNYSDNWACKGKISYEYSGMFFLRRLLVNGVAIEVYVTNQEAVALIEHYELIQLSGVKIRSVNDLSLAVIKNKCQLRVVGMYAYSEPQNQLYDQYRRSAIARLSPYKEDLVKLLFNEDLDTSKLQIFSIERKTKEENNAVFLQG